MSMTDQAHAVQDAAASATLKVTAAATYGGSGAAVFFGLTANEIAALGGLAVAVVAAIGNLWLTWFYKHKHYQLARAKRASDALASLVDEGEE